MGVLAKMLAIIKHCSSQYGDCSSWPNSNEV